MSEEKKGTKKWIKGLLWAGIVVAVGLIVFGVYSLISAQRQAREYEEALNALREQVVSNTPAAEPTPAQTVQPAPATPAPEPPPTWDDPNAVQPDREIDFAALQAINPDVYAWITVPGTDIDYPIAYARDGSGFYLNHDYKGDSSKYGAIFTDYYNSVDFTDRVTLIYGHNMKDGSMFAQLHRFEDATFFEENPVIRIYLKDYMLEYEIIAAYKASDENIMAIYDFSDDSVFTQYTERIYQVRDMNAKLRERELTLDDKLIVLATCVKGEAEARYLVHGRLKTND